MDVNATFVKIAQLLNSSNYIDFGIDRRLRHLAPEGNIVFTIIDKLRNRFTAIVYQNPETGDLLPPLLDQIPYLVRLPSSILIEVIIQMNLPDALRICRVDKYINANICENDDFWKGKYIHDFGIGGITAEEERIRTIPNYWKQRYWNSGKVYSFGTNSSGQLGLGDEAHRDRPTLIIGIPPIRSISVDTYHSLLLDISGKPYSFGMNCAGQLGLGDTTDRNIPTLITGTPPLPPIGGISIGDAHSLLLDVNGGVWVFGSNRYGQLGLGNHGKRTERDNPTLITSIPPIKAISAGSDYSSLLDGNGGVWSFGLNYRGRLGLRDTINRDIPTLITDIPPIRSISAGGDHSLLIDGNDRVWTYGNNHFGQLGLGDGTDRDRPILITSIPPVKSISAGYNYSLILDTSGGVWSFGHNHFGQLGLGDRGPGTDRNRPTLITGIPPIRGISAGGHTSSLLDTSGKVWSFGANGGGQLGLGDRTDRDRPTLITGIPSIRDISAGIGYFLLVSY